MNAEETSFQEWLTLAGGERTVRAAAVIVLIGTLAFIAMLFYDLRGFGDHRLSGAIVLLPVSICSLLLLRFDKPMAAYLVLLWGTLVAITLSALIVAGLRSGMVFAFPVVIMGAMPLGPRNVLLMTAASILGVIGLALAEHFSLLPPPRTSQSNFLALIYVFVLATAGLVAAAMVREQKRLHDKAAKAVADREQSLQALAGQERELRLFTDNAPAMICAYNGMTCRFANPRYAEFFGFTVGTVVGRHLRDVIGEEAYAQARPLVERALAGEHVTYRAKRRSPSQGDRVMEVKLVSDQDGGFYCLLFDITEQERVEAALRESEQRLREAQRIGHFGSFDFDLATGRMTWSDELYRINGRGKDEFNGTWQGLLDMIHPDDVPLMSKAGREAAQANGLYEVRHRILTRDGRTKHIHVRFEVFRDSEGKPVRTLGTAQDITEQVQARAEIEHLNERLEARVRERTAELQSANKELESFAYSISHDLRAPLRGIDGFSHLLDEEYGDRLDEQGRGYLQRVRTAAQRMGALIDDILELSRVTRKQMVRVSVDLSRMAAEILDELRQADPGRPVEAHVAEGIGVQGDPQLLRVMMQNLLENAWKYSGKTDRARIEFGRETEGERPCLFVRDNGAGFDMRYAGRLFAPFQRLHKPSEFEGTGIGLATVARIVQRHGGQIRAEAEPGKGATFRFTLDGKMAGSAKGDGQQ